MNTRDFQTSKTSNGSNAKCVCTYPLNEESGQGQITHIESHWGEAGRAEAGKILSRMRQRTGTQGSRAAPVPARTDWMLARQDSGIGGPPGQDDNDDADDVDELFHTEIMALYRQMNEAIGLLHEQTSCETSLPATAISQADGSKLAPSKENSRDGDPN